MSGFKPYAPDRHLPEEMRRRASDIFVHLDGRRSVRHFAPDAVPRELIEAAIRVASTAPSGAHRQPWRFVAVSDPQLKARIRGAVEAEERRSYEERMPTEWREAIEPMGTDWTKPYLEVAPWLVVVFELPWEPDASSPTGRRKNYYVRESVGIACGLFIAALHHIGLVTLTHTPSPMGFLSDLLGRPSHERPFMLFPVGHPAPDAVVPELRRKGLGEVADFL